jgi:hypothetical protein
MHFARLKYFTYHLVPVLASNYKQHILSQDKLRKICYLLPDLTRRIRVAYRRFGKTHCLELQCINKSGRYDWTRFFLMAGNNIEVLKVLRYIKDHNSNFHRPGKLKFQTRNVSVYFVSPKNDRNVNGGGGGWTIRRQPRHVIGTEQFVRAI